MSEEISKSPVAAGNDKPFIELEPKQKKMLTVTLLAELFLILFFNAAVKSVGSNITSDLGDASLFGFMNTVFFLCSTSMMPLSTKIGDKVGRKPIIAFGVALYTVSLLIAGTTHSMIVHIIFRGGQGFGQGCMLANSLAFLGEINTKQQRNRALGMYSVITGITNIIAPIAGGAITDALSWRFTCWGAVPFGIIVFFLVLRFMPKRVIRAETKMDISGAVAIAVTISSIVLYTSFGAKYGFTSTFGITLICLFVVGAVATGIIEKKATAPCLDFSLLKSKSFAITLAAVALLAPAMFATGAYIANYAMAVKGLSATWSSTFVSLNSVGLLIMGSIYTWISVRISVKKLCVFDAILFVINVIMMITFNTATPMWFIILTVLVQGARTSIYMPGYTTSLQNDMPPEITGSATATVQFVQSLSGTIGISVMSMLLNAKFKSGLGNVIPEGLLNYVQKTDITKFMSATYLMSNKAKEVADFQATLPAEAQSLFQQMMTNVRDAYAGGLSFAYTIIMVLCLLGLVCSILMLLWDPAKKQKK